MQIPAGEFKAKCLELMNHVSETHEEIIVTKYGKPVVKIVAIDEEPTRPLFGFLRGTLSIQGDIVATTGETWETEND